MKHSRPWAHFAVSAALIGAVSGTYGHAAAQLVDNGDSVFLPPSDDGLGGSGGIETPAGAASWGIEDNTFVVHASDGNNAVEAPAESMTFNTVDDFLFYVQQQFGGTLEYDPEGTPNEVHGTAIIYGEPYYADATTQKAVAIDDFMAFMMGGTSGIVTIGGQQVCLRADGCLSADFAQKAAPPKKDKECSANNHYCVSSESFNNKFPPIPFLAVYKSIGTEVSQGRGGYQEHSHFCINGILPWICTDKSGSNQLTVRNAYNLEGERGLVGAVAQDRAQANNATSVTSKQWSVFASLKFDSEGDLKKVGTTCGAQCSITGVCGASGGADKVTQDGASTATAWGSVGDACP